MIGPLSPETVIKIAIHSAARVIGYANARDIAQDVWIRYQQHAGSELDWPILRARGWIWRVARNLAFDSSRRRREIPSDMFDFDITSDEPKDQQDHKKQVKALLDTLSNQDQQMMQLRYYKGMSWVEVGTTMGIGENLLRCRHTRIKTRWTSGKIQITV